MKHSFQLSTILAVSTLALVGTTFAGEYAPIGRTPDNVREIIAGLERTEAALSRASVNYHFHLKTFYDGTTVGRDEEVDGWISQDGTSRFNAYSITLRTGFPPEMALPDGTAKADCFAWHRGNVVVHQNPFDTLTVATRTESATPDNFGPTIAQHLPPLRRFVTAPKVSLDDEMSLADAYRRARKGTTTEITPVEGSTAVLVTISIDDAVWIRRTIDQWGSGPDSMMFTTRAEYFNPPGSPNARAVYTATYPSATPGGVPFPIQATLDDPSRNARITINYDFGPVKVGAAADAPPQDIEAAIAAFTNARPGEAAKPFKSIRAESGTDTPNLGVARRPGGLTPEAIANINRAAGVAPAPAR